MKHPIPVEAFDQNIIILGKTRSGKSSAMRVMVEGLLDADKPVCIIDPKGDWWGLKSSADGKKPGYPIVVFGGEHADVPINRAAGAGVAELFATGNRPCLIDLGGWMVSERTQFFVDFASMLFKTTRGRRWLVIDEVHNFTPKGKVYDPDAGKMLHWANRLASEGLGKGIGLLAASQRPQKVHNDFLTSCETLIAMRVIHKSDRDAIDDWIMGAADPDVGKKVLAELASMKRGEAWAWSPEISFGPERIKFPLFRTYDSFKPQTSEQPAKLKGWADVNLDDVKAKLASVVKEAEANDPAKLKARIRELEKQLQGAPAKTREVLVPDPKAIDRAVRHVHVKFEQFHKETWNDVSRAIMAAMNQAIRRELPKVSGAEIQERGRAVSFHGTARKNVSGADAVNSFADTPRPKEVFEGEVPKITGTAARLLSALRQFHPEPKSAAQIAMLAGVSTRLSTWRIAIAKLRKYSLISESGDAIALTAAGLAAAPDVSAIPDSGEGRVAFWRKKLKAKALEMFNVLVDCYPRGLDRGELGDRAGVDPSVSTFRIALAALRKAGVIEEADGQFKASEGLFT